MARALGHGPEDSYADNIFQLTPYLRGTVGLLFTNRTPEQLLPYLENLAGEKVDFARAGATAPRSFVVPYGTVYSTGGEVPAEHDVPLGHTLEPELRRLGMPVRMVKGRVELEQGPEGGNEDGVAACDHQRKYRDHEGGCLSSDEYVASEAESHGE